MTLGAPSPLDGEGDISVAIVHYRTPAILAECLASIEQVRPHRVGQVVVVDNSSGENDGTVPDRYPWVDWIFNAENVHFRRGCNQAAIAARGPYVLFLNPDTRLVDSGSIERLAAILDERPDIGMVGPMMRGDNDLLAPQGAALAGLKALWRGFQPSGADPTDATKHVAAVVDTLSAAALLCRRSDFVAVGGFDERARMYWEEHELARKFRRRGLRAYYEPSAFVHHRWRRGGSDLLSEIHIYFSEAERVYYRNYSGRLGAALFSLKQVARRLRKIARRSAAASA